MGRELTEDGREDAYAAGKWLRQRGYLPDHVLVSSATRTKQTWEQVRRSADQDIEADVDSSLYSAGPETVLDVVRLVPAAARTVLLVGHNPTVSQLAQLLSDGLADAHLLADMTRGYPPATLTILEFREEWLRLDFGGARVTGFHVARG